MTAISSPTLGGGAVGGYLTSPTGSSIQLLTGSPNHNGGHSSLIGGLGGVGVVGMPESHMGVQEHQANMLAASGSSGIVMGAPSYDGGELIEMKKRR